jgi:uncharacterized protein
VDNSVEIVENPLSDLELANLQLGVFAKQPIPGQVKTRLTPPLSTREAAELYSVSLRETLTRCTAAGLAPILFYRGDHEYFATAFPELELVPQVAGDLGSRMGAAMRHLLSQAACQGAALIGSDSPDLPLALLGEAFATLGDTDCLVAPAADGGYVLIGMRRYYGELFEQIPWSSSGVLEATRRKAREGGVNYREIACWEDVDDLHSLHRLLKRSPWSQTARYAAKRLAEYFPGQAS